MRTLFAIAVVAALVLSVALAGVATYRALRCRAFTDPQGGRNIACRVVPW